MKLTGPNHSIDLISSRTHDARDKRLSAPMQARVDTQTFAPKAVGYAEFSVRLHGLVVMARGKAPDSIPNSAVKTLSADGTAS